MPANVKNHGTPLFYLGMVDVCTISIHTLAFFALISITYNEGVTPVTTITVPAPLPALS